MTFKLNTKINVASKIKKQLFNFTRVYHSKGELQTDSIECKVLGINRQNPQNPQVQNPNQPTPMDQTNNSLEETLIKIDGCDSHETAMKVKNCLSYYGEIVVYMFISDSSDLA